jgi:hypothetical protein
VTLRRALLASTVHLTVRSDGESECAPDGGYRRNRGLVGHPNGFHLTKIRKRGGSNYVAVERLKSIGARNSGKPVSATTRRGHVGRGDPSA